jgi:pSer/pThr/pTyr-binding forkhead associated (FHA) protein
MQSKLFLLNRSVLTDLQNFPLDPGTYVAGRSTKCDLVVADHTISRRHAEITVADEAVTVRDLRSRNGVFIDRKRIQSSALLPGQFLRLGRIIFLLAREGTPAWDVDSATVTADHRELEGQTIPEHVAMRLTPAQIAVVLLLQDGRSEKHIAARLTLSPHTVHNHIREIYRALGVHKQSELVALLLHDRDS